MSTMLFRKKEIIINGHIKMIKDYCTCVCSTEYRPYYFNVLQHHTVYSSHKYTIIVSTPKYEIF